MSQKTLIGLLILFAAAIILFSIAIKLQASTKKGFRGADCLSSVTLSTFTKADLVVKAYQGTDEFCPRYELNFLKKKSDLKLISFSSIGQKEKSLFKRDYYDELTDKFVLGNVANEMRVCFKQFGSGKMPVFWVPQTFWNKLFGTPNEAIGCRICTEISFEDGAVNHKITGLKDYLKTHDITKSATEDEDGSFYHYLAEHTAGCGDLTNIGENCWEQFAISDDVLIDTNITIDPKEIYNVVFIRKNIDKGEGIMNVYLLSSDTTERVCKLGLPYI